METERGGKKKNWKGEKRGIVGSAPDRGAPVFSPAVPAGSVQIFLAIGDKMRQGEGKKRGTMPRLAGNTSSGL